MHSRQPKPIRAQSYALLETLQRGSFSGAVDLTRGHGDLVYLSFVTLATVGYGPLPDLEQGPPQRLAAAARLARELAVLFVDFPIAFPDRLLRRPVRPVGQGAFRGRARRARNDRRRLLGRIFAQTGPRLGPRLREELAPNAALAAVPADERDAGAVVFPSAD